MAEPKTKLKNIKNRDDRKEEEEEEEKHNNDISSLFPKNFIAHTQALALSSCSKKHFNLIEWPNVSRVLHKTLWKKILCVNKDEKRKVLQILLFFFFSFLLLLLLPNQKEVEWGCQLFYEILILALFIIEQMSDA